MKYIYSKLSLIIVFSLLIIVGINAQTIPLVILEPNLTVDINGDTIDEHGLASAFEIDKTLWVANPNNQAITIKCKKTEIDMLAGTENITCWGICPSTFDPAGTNTPAFVTVGGVEMTETAGAQDTIRSFSAHYKPMNLDGCSMIKYEWYDQNNLNTALASVYIRFIHTATGVCTPANINENIDYSFDIFPNPANKSINIILNKNINTNDKISIDIYDLIGKKVLSADIKNLNNNQISLPTENLKQGVYLVSISKNGNTVTTNRLMIEH